MSADYYCCLERATVVHRAPAPRQGLIKFRESPVVGDAQDGECSLGVVADGAGGLGDVVGS
ncbi:hypothetical protein [Streptomyces malaysiensis]|uniref:hypothetical protein n=1 Tax=Streptomyces malaysiensis TaxID=92644 RepID=UPI001AD90940|nr:hypothetical protein [Streptomyces malaysiensis]